MAETFGLPGIDEILSMSAEEQERNDREIAEKIAAQEYADKIDNYRKCGIGERFFDESLETYKERNEESKLAKEIVQNFLKDIRQGKFRSLKIIGSNGNGKTHLAGAVLREYGGKYRTTSQLVVEYQSTKAFSANLKEKDLIEIYGSTKLLVIDEIGRSNCEKDEKYMLYTLINARYERRLPTIVIGNFNKVDFAAFVGEAVTDRLNESVITVEFTGDSYRIEKRTD